MFQDTYVKLDALETETALEKINATISDTRFSPASTIILTRELPFYPGYRFLDVADHAHLPHNRRFLLQSDTEIIVLDYTNTPVYALNARLPINLNDASAADYARFFFSFVRGRHGRFLIVESIEDIPWRDDPPPSARKALAKMLHPLDDAAVKPRDPYRWAWRAQVLFRDTLFQGDIYITPDGTVDLKDIEMLLEDLPVLDDTLGQ